MLFFPFNWWLKAYLFMSDRNHLSLPVWATHLGNSVSNSPFSWQYVICFPTRANLFSQTKVTFIPQVYGPCDGIWVPFPIFLGILQKIPAEKVHDQLFRHSTCTSKCGRFQAKTQWLCKMFCYRSFTSALWNWWPRPWFLTSYLATSLETLVAGVVYSVTNFVGRWGSNKRRVDFRSFAESICKHMCMNEKV